MEKMNWKRKEDEKPMNHISVHEKGEVVYLTFPILEQFSWITHGFSTRLGGVSQGEIGSMNLSFGLSLIHILAGEEGLSVMCALFETYMERGGMQLQVNVVDAETLKAAQVDPEQYRSLCVRVTGYSAFFVEMGKKAQNELIARTEHMVS